MRGAVVGVGETSVGGPKPADNEDIQTYGEVKIHIKLNTGLFTHSQTHQQTTEVPTQCP